MSKTHTSLANLFLVSATLAAVPLAAGCSEKAHTQDNTAVKAPDGPKMVKFDPKSLERLGIKIEAAGSNAGALDLEVPGSLEYNLDKYAEVGTLVDGRLTTITVKAGDSAPRAGL